MLSDASSSTHTCVNDPTADDTAKHAEQTDAVEAHHMSDHVAHPPARTQRLRLPLLGRQSRQQIGQVCPLGGGHLETVHGINSS